MISCANEDVDQIKDNKSLDFNVGVKNGRLFFLNKELLTSIYSKYANASDESVSRLIDPFIDKGFHSLRPVVTADNDERIYKYYTERLRENTYLSKLSKSKKNLRSLYNENDVLNYLDDLEDVIGDDTFAAFLNSNGEIQVGNEIFKYTDVGLFIVNEDKYTVLEDYLEFNNISNDLMFETAVSSQIMISNDFPDSGVTQINSDLSYFNVQINSSNTVASGNYNVTPGSAVSSDPSYNSFISNLISCDPRSGLFGSLFGDNNVCIDHYEDRRRVKTKAFNYNYLLVYHLGVKCVNQYRGWTGLWRVEAADEVRLVVEAAQFEYNLDALLGNNAVTNLTKERSYFMNNQKAFFSGPNTINFSNQWGAPLVSYINQTSLPQVFQNTGSGLTFEFFGSGDTWLDEKIQKGIDSNLNATKLNSYFYNGLFSTVKGQLQSAFGSSIVVPDNRTFVAKYPLNGKMIIQKSVNSTGFNVGVRKQTFDWGVQLCLSGGIDDWNIKPETSCGVLVKPTNYRVKIIGAVRRGNNWHGSKFSDGID